MIALLFFIFAGISIWVISAVISKGKYQFEIQEVLVNIYEGLKYVVSGIKDLVILLIKDSMDSTKKLNVNISKNNVINILNKKDTSETTESKAA